MIYGGFDLGIVTSKAVLIKDGDIIASEIFPYNGLPREAYERTYENVLKNAGVSESTVERWCSTGFGGKVVTCAQEIIPEHLCLSRAVKMIDPEIRTVFDVGGHCIAAFGIGESGRLLEHAIIDDCAAGTGMFIDIMAKALNISVDDLSRVAYGSNILHMTSQCIILAESEVISHINEGKNLDDIKIAIIHTVAARIAGQVRRIGISEKVAMVGGVAKNEAVVKLLQEKLGVEFHDFSPLDPRLIQAYGAALVAERMTE